MSAEKKTQCIYTLAIHALIFKQTETHISKQSHTQMNCHLNISYDLSFIH